LAWKVAKNDLILDEFCFFVTKSKGGFGARKIEKKAHNVEMWEAENEASAAMV